MPYIYISSANINIFKLARAYNCHQLGIAPSIQRWPSGIEVSIVTSTWSRVVLTFQWPLTRDRSMWLGCGVWSLASENEWWIFFLADWWFGTCILFFHILGIIIRLIFFRGVETTNQLGFIWTNNSRNRKWQWYNPLQMEALMGNLSTSMGIFRERSHYWLPENNMNKRFCSR